MIFKNVEMKWKNSSGYISSKLDFHMKLKIIKAEYICKFAEHSR